jgi:hypothetical protein
MGRNDQEGLAWGRFDDQIAQTGWSELFMETSSSPDLSNDAKMYAAGFAEGLLTSIRISEHYANTYRLLVQQNEQPLSVLKAVFQKQLDQMRRKTNLEGYVRTTPPSDAYLRQARYVLVQLWGICDGYNHIARISKVRTLSLEDMFMLNSAAEIPQLLDAFASKLGRDPVEQKLQRRGSALVRLANGNSDIFVGHTTWEDYSKMLRVFKYYKFQLDGGAETKATNIGFSSYPGALSSTDDFYVMNTGITAMATSLEVLDPTALWTAREVVKRPRTPTFIHVMAVNRLATSAANWAHLFASEGPPNYASQWMVVDYNLFDAGSVVADNTFWVVEVMGSVNHAEDVSALLRTKGFWPSTNRPYFADIRTASGHAAAQQRLIADPVASASMTWDVNNRAVLFGKGAIIANDVLAMGLLMSQNTDPDTGTNPAGPDHEISARMELMASAARPKGGIDAKVAGRCTVQSLSPQALSGPSHWKQVPFSWLNAQGQESWPGWPHTGLPDVWNFGFVQMTPGGASDQLINTAVC